MASTFSIEDIRLLEKTTSIRERLIDNYLEKESLPTKARDLEAFTNLLESVDRSIFNKAKINIEENANKINEETKHILSSLILDLHKNTNTRVIDTENQEPPSFQSQGMAIQEGELILKSDNQDISQFFQTKMED